MRVAVMAYWMVFQSGAEMMFSWNSASTSAMSASAFSLRVGKRVRWDLSTTTGGRKRSKASERNFSRCVQAITAGRILTLKSSSPRLQARSTASSAMCATPLLNLVANERKLETPSGAKPTQVPCSSASYTARKVSTLNSAARSPCSRRRKTGTAPDMRIMCETIGMSQSVFLAQKRTVRGVCAMSTMESARLLPWLKHSRVGSPSAGTFSRPRTSVLA
mmetsp:Transcript_18308/g.52608  ORF Transcript_18308/g.52608 Transcript_18308/m.52608 type:complete len:219 (-) Transcript_18308:133-789(-)